MDTDACPRLTGCRSGLACFASIHETILRSGANPEMGLALYSIFQEIGLPAPNMHLEIPLGSDIGFVRVISDLLCSLQPLARQHNVSRRGVGRP